MYIILIILAVLVIYFISLQRQFVNLDELVKNALSQIGIQQKSRWDALTQLANATKSYSQHEHDVLIEAIQARRLSTTPTTPEAIEQQDAAMNSVLSRLIAVAEAYPDLKANTLYQETMRSLNDYEAHVRRSRSVYNDTVTKWNRLVKQFPSNLVASILGHHQRDYLEEDPAKADMPELF